MNRLTVLLLLASAPALAEDAFYLKSGDRVVFYGDSITDQRLYTTFIETFIVTRFPSLEVERSPIPAGAAIEWMAEAADPSTCASNAMSSPITPPL